MSDKERTVQRAERGVDWKRVCEVLPGEHVLEKSGYLEVVDSRQTEAGYWMLRYAHGVTYHHNHAPVAFLR